MATTIELFELCNNVTNWHMRWHKSLVSSVPYDWFERLFVKAFYAAFFRSSQHLHKYLTLQGFALRCCCLERLFEIDDYFCILFSHPGEPLASGEVLGGLGHILGVHFADFEQLLETSPEQIVLLVDSSLRQGIVNSIAQFFPTKRRHNFPSSNFKKSNCRNWGIWTGQQASSTRTHLQSSAAYITNFFWGSRFTCLVTESPKLFALVD